MSRGVATKRRRSRHQSRIHREEAGAGRTADTDPEGTAGCINARDFLRFARPIGCFVALADTLFLLCFFEPASGRSSSNYCTKSSAKKVRGKRDYLSLLPLNTSCNCLPELESPVGHPFQPDTAATKSHGLRLESLSCEKDRIRKERPPFRKSGECRATHSPKQTLKNLPLAGTECFLHHWLRNAVRIP